MTAMDLLLHIVAWILLLTILFLFPLKLWCVVRKRRSSRVVNWVLLSAFLLLPIMSQSQYMFLNEPMVEAAGDGDYKKVETLLRFGASVNCEADDGRGTALLAAIRGGHRDVVRLLIGRGANVNQVTLGFLSERDTCTPLQVAAGHPQMIALLRKAGAKK